MLLKLIPSLLVALILGLVYALIHHANSLFFKFFEFSSHISFIYVPAFLRLANVLVLGWFWGAIGTMVGGIFLIAAYNEVFVDAFPNVLVSSLGASSALGLFLLSHNRKFNLNLMRDWFNLTLLCAFCNATLHHVYWIAFEPYQLQQSIQVAWMIAGDVIGTIVGVIFFRLVITRVSLPDSDKYYDK